MADLAGHFAGAGWWVLACTVGWIAAGPVGGFLGWPAFGAVYGAITGTVLVWLLRHSATLVNPILS